MYPEIMLRRRVFLWGRFKADLNNYFHTHRTRQRHICLNAKFLQHASSTKSKYTPGQQ